MATVKPKLETIETAPRDGTHILGWCERPACPPECEGVNGDNFCFPCYYEEDFKIETGFHVVHFREGWVEADGYEVLDSWVLVSREEFFPEEGYTWPTHWMPIAAPPVRGE